MAKLIKQIYDLVALATDKGLTSYWSDDQIMNGIHKAQMGFFRELLDEFAKTKKIRNELIPFQVTTSITITNKIGTLPANYFQERDATVNYQSADWPVNIIEDSSFRVRVNDPIVNPTTDFKNLIANIYNDSGDKIELSAQITPLKFRYFKVPTKPVYATVLTNGQYIYNDGGSTDVDWSDTTHDIIVDRSLLIFGLSIRDNQVQRVGMQSIPGERSGI